MYLYDIVLIKRLYTHVGDREDLHCPGKYNIPWLQTSLHTLKSMNTLTKISCSLEFILRFIFLLCYSKYKFFIVWLLVFEIKHIALEEVTSPL